MNKSQEAHKKPTLVTLENFFNTTRQRITKWKKDDSQPALNFALKYLDNELIEEFIRTGEIKSFNPENISSKNILNFVLPQILRNTIKHFENINNKSTILYDFYKKTNYEIPFCNSLKEFDLYYLHLEDTKDHFYDKFDLFLRENKDKYSNNAKFVIQSHIDDVMQDELILYFFLNNLFLCDKNKLNEFKRDVDKYGIVKTFLKDNFYV